jgi:hypothetical protein
MPPKQKVQEVQAEERTFQARFARMTPMSTALAPAPAPATSTGSQVAAAYGLSAADWRRYEQDGFLRLGRTLDEAALAGLSERIDDYMLGRRREDGLMMQLDLGGDYGAMAPMTLGFKGPRLDYRKIEGLERDERFLAFMRHPCFRAVCARVYGAGAPVSAFRAMFMNKPAGKGTVLPWHQDGGGIWDLDRDPLVTSWTALDDATIENGCVEVVPGSHRLGLLSAHGHTISAEQIDAYCAAERVVHLEVKAGESVLLHNWTLHRSGINRTSNSRRAFSVCYMDGRTRRKGDGLAFPEVFAAA